MKEFLKRFVNNIGYKNVPSYATHTLEKIPINTPTRSVCGAGRLESD